MSRDRGGAAGGASSSGTITSTISSSVVVIDMTSTIAIARTANASHENSFSFSHARR